MIQELLYKYLVLNGQLGLPDIGSFSIHREPATVDSNGAVLLAPTQQIRFEAKSVQADKNLFLFLAQETEADEVTVIGKFNDWVKITNEKISQNGVVELPFIGNLSRAADGNYLFDALATDFGYISVPLPDGTIWLADTTEEETVIESSDSGWWIYAIILLLLGIAAITYRYL